jgi:hypothetical protein
MDKKNICARKHWIVIFGILICVSICMVLVPSLRPDGIIKLSSATSSSATSQEPNQHSAPAGTAPTQENQTPAIPQSANPSVSAVTQTAVKLGALSCISRINQVAAFLTANTQSGVFIFPVQRQADQHIFSTSFELLRPDNSTIYASASFFPNIEALHRGVVPACR